MALLSTSKYTHSPLLKDNNGQNALHIAAERSYIDICETLLKQKEYQNDVNLVHVCDNGGNTALDLVSGGTKQLTWGKCEPKYNKINKTTGKSERHVKGTGYSMSITEPTPKNAKLCTFDFTFPGTKALSYLQIGLTEEKVNLTKLTTHQKSVFTWATYASTLAPYLYSMKNNATNKIILSIKI